MRFRRKIYVAHPYGGKAENVLTVQEKIRDWLPYALDTTFVSPLHATGFLYEDTMWEEGLLMCFDLMDDCDCVVFCNGWEKSKGCTLEMIRCINRGQKYFFEKDIDLALTYTPEKDSLDKDGDICYTVLKGGEEMNKFEIGDTVELLVPVYSFDSKGNHGVVKYTTSTFVDVLFEGHDSIESYPVSVLRLSKSKPKVEVYHFGDMKIVFNYPHTIIVRNGITARVKLHGDDVYSKWGGFEEAMKKLVKKGGI